MKPKTLFSQSIFLPHLLLFFCTTASATPPTAPTARALDTASESRPSLHLSGTGFLRSPQTAPYTYLCQVSVDQFPDPDPTDRQMVFETSSLCTHPEGKVGIGRNKISLIEWNENFELLAEGKVVGQISFSPQGQLSEIRLDTPSSLAVLRREKSDWVYYLNEKDEQGAIRLELGAKLRDGTVAREKGNL